eukprot:COSAG02_NODE_46938_length_345_cov_0.597561_1_plen_70_part_10
MPTEAQDFQNEVFWNPDTIDKDYLVVLETRWAEDLLQPGGTSITSASLINLGHAIIVIAHRNQPDHNKAL